MLYLNYFLKKNIVRHWTHWYKRLNEGLYAYLYIIVCVLQAYCTLHRNFSILHFFLTVCLSLYLSLSFCLLLSYSSIFFFSPCLSFTSFSLSLISLSLSPSFPSFSLTLCFLSFVLSFTLILYFFCHSTLSLSCCTIPSFLSLPPSHLPLSPLLSCPAQLFPPIFLLKESGHAAEADSGWTRGKQSAAPAAPAIHHWLRWHHCCERQAAHILYTNTHTHQRVAPIHMSSWLGLLQADWRWGKVTIGMSVTYRPRAPTLWQANWIDQRVMTLMLAVLGQKQ